MTRLIKEIIMDTTSESHRIQASAIDALCEASEAHLVTLFESKEN
jgi:histone H3/H4